MKKRGIIIVFLGLKHFINKCLCCSKVYRARSCWIVFLNTNIYFKLLDHSTYKHFTCKELLIPIIKQSRIIYWFVIWLNWVDRYVVIFIFCSHFNCEKILNCLKGNRKTKEFWFVFQAVFLLFIEWCVYRWIIIGNIFLY